jgi:hypothetical protein
MHAKVCMHKHFNVITNSFKCKCAIRQIFTHPSQKFNDEYKMEFLNNGFTIFKMNDSIHVQMLIVQKM